MKVRQVADAHAHVQMLVSVAKMAIVLEGYTTEVQRSVVRFSVCKRSQCKDINKEIFLVYCGKCLSHKEVHN
jgi:hypothetical protein